MGEGDGLDMTKNLALTKFLVKRAIDESISQGQSQSVADFSTLAKRIEWLLAHLPPEADGKKVSARGLARLARLKSESHIGLIIQGRVPTPSADVLSKIAQAGGVRLEWLADGTGEPFEGEDGKTLVVSDRIHPTIEHVGRELGFSENERAAASSSVFGLRGTSEMTEEQAREILEDVRRQRRNLARLLRENEAVVDDDLGGGAADISPRGQKPRGDR